MHFSGQKKSFPLFPVMNDLTKYGPFSLKTLTLLNDPVKHGYDTPCCRSIPLLRDF